MAYLFDTDAVSEMLRPRPAHGYVAWLGTVPREEQFISAVTVGELFKGAFRSPARERHLGNIEQRIIPSATVLPYDVATGRVFGEISATLELGGARLEDADLQIAATAIHHGLELVTGNVRHFTRVPGLRINGILAQSR
jgi:predicted nucleic acid-binding protein